MGALVSGCPPVQEAATSAAQIAPERSPERLTTP